MTGKGGSGKKDPSMMEDDYFIAKNANQKKLYVPQREKNKHDINYSGKIGIQTYEVHNKRKEGVRSQVKFSNNYRMT